jgi:triacylglycerol lipase
MFGFDQLKIGPITLSEYFRTIPEALRAAGNRVLVTRVHPTAGVERRAAKLAERIEAAYPSGPLHIVGHSMGGLDARILLTDPAWRRRVLSLTTIGTPHLGSALADLARFRMRPIYQGLGWIGWDYNGFLEVRRSWARAFHRRVPPPEGVHCFSLAGDPHPEETCPIMRPLRSLLEEREGPNDGLVSTRSALAFGTPLPTWPLDHLRQMNWFPSGPNDPPVPSALALYGHVVDQLVDLGFGEASPVEWDETVGSAAHPLDLISP